MSSYFAPTIPPPPTLICRWTGAGYSWSFGPSADAPFGGILGGAPGIVPAPVSPPLSTSQTPNPSPSVDQSNWILVSTNRQPGPSQPNPTSPPLLTALSGPPLFFVEVVSLNKPPSPPSARLTARRPPFPPNYYFRCLRQGHFARTCSLPLACLSCRCPGHLARACPKTLSPRSAPSGLLGATPSVPPSSTSHQPHSSFTSSVSPSIHLFPT